MFRQDCTCPALLEDDDAFYRYGTVTPYGAPFKRFAFLHHRHWPGPGSLATTTGVSFDVLSSGY
jgi:hypothetical protein